METNLGLAVRGGGEAQSRHSPGTAMAQRSGGRPERKLISAARRREARPRARHGPAATNVLAAAPGSHVGFVKNKYGGKIKYFTVSSNLPNKQFQDFFFKFIF